VQRGQERVREERCATGNRVPRRGLYCLDGDVVADGRRRGGREVGGGVIGGIHRTMGIFACLAAVGNLHHRKGKTRWHAEGASVAHAKLFVVNGPSPCRSRSHS
jgi:hypothetical protein